MAASKLDERTNHTGQQGSSNKHTDFRSMRLMSVYRHSKCVQRFHLRLFVYGESRDHEEQSLHLHRNQELSAQCRSVLMPGLNFPFFGKPINIDSIGNSAGVGRRYCGVSHLSRTKKNDKSRIILPRESRRKPKNGSFFNSSLRKNSDPLSGSPNLPAFSRVRFERNFRSIEFMASRDSTIDFEWR
jgi:hypothetical protein